MKAPSARRLLTATGVQCAILWVYLGELPIGFRLKSILICSLLQAGLWTYLHRRDAIITAGSFPDWLRRPLLIEPCEVAGRTPEELAWYRRSALVHLGTCGGMLLISLVLAFTEPEETWFCGLWGACVICVLPSIYRCWRATCK